MALIKSPECNNLVSNIERMCPNCGFSQLLATINQIKKI